MAFLAGLGFFQYIFRVGNNTLIQTMVPDALRSRMMSIYMLDNVSPAGDNGHQFPDPHLEPRRGLHGDSLGQPGVGVAAVGVLPAGQGQL